MRIGKVNRGFTLVELMIVVAIIGILAALAVYGVSKYVNNAKTTEAISSVGAMSKAAIGSYAREGMDGTKLNLGNSSGFTRAICGTAANKVPTSVASVASRKYQSAPTEWDTNGQLDGWSCLRFVMTAPQYYQYNYVATGTSGTGAHYTAVANGDLDGDGTLSTFSLSGTIQSDSSGMVLTPDPGILEAFPTE